MIGVGEQVSSRLILVQSDVLAVPAATSNRPTHLLLAAPYTY